MDTKRSIPERDELHASAVSFQGRGLLILGPPGAGKTTLAFGLIAFGATLISDDRTRVERGPDGDIVISAPSSLAGLIEFRGAGILRLTHTESAHLWLAVDLGRPAATRMPELQTMEILGEACPVIPALGHPGLAAALTVTLRAGNLPDPELSAARDAAPQDNCSPGSSG